MSSTIEILKDRLFWCSSSPTSFPKNSTTTYCFSIDNELVYFPFYLDFGPLNLGMVFRYCKKLEAILSDPAHFSKQIIQLTTLEHNKRANSACLICCFLIIVLGMTPEEAYSPFAHISPPFVPYRDATHGNCTYPCTVFDCLKGLYYGMSLGWFNYNTFNLVDYEHYERVENGDMNWLVPNKFLAFSGPTANGIIFENGRTLTPIDYIPIFKEKKIGLVIRLNNKQYDNQIFIKNGIDHLDLFFPDGSCPSTNIIKTFIQVSEQYISKNMAIAVHCKAGLGRTGTLIGFYCMKNYHFPAAAFIGWSRLCRPGCVLGPQQQFLNEKENEAFSWGSIEKDKKDEVDTSVGGENSRYSTSTINTFNLSPKISMYNNEFISRLSTLNSSPLLPSANNNNEYLYEKSAAKFGSQSIIAKNGDNGQGERLMAVRISKKKEDDKGTNVMVENTSTDAKQSSIFPFRTRN